ncbi:methyltransferase domain-containing protein [Dysgonomonas sp. 216]|uniref:tRNA1(Val) (adenine(37)-N6)-methyltransferase n=1 Tax=Dysgonomonas sp. 216 TaxID=2302934 RepID=UPI0013D18735|nr:methyltransferase [Dysgonomonas sp. 216]NDW18503.1 methyltransferase domain-containing protein [Dysgonomonas sp. 216]
MSNPYFKFKQFTVFHDRCAMKVGTDGVLLGSWVNMHDTDKILDVGTGSGLVALMLAQRNRLALIDAIEIDSEAAQQALDNFEASSFSNITSCINTPYQTFAKVTTNKYNLIVSNPPFFSRSLKSPNEKRSTARHTDSLFIEDFICLSQKLLTDNGRISFIFPYSELEYLEEIAKKNTLSVSRLTKVYPTPSGEAKRILIELSVNNCERHTDSLIIETERHVYSPAFADLVKDFYLKM